MPKNILLSGPTGCGKTELARRIATLCDSPFLKVQATKYTEVGYVGKDVSTIIEDLARISIANYRKHLYRRVDEAGPILDEVILEQITAAMLGPEHSEENFQEKLAELRTGQYDSKNITMWPITPRLPEHFPLPPPYFPMMGSLSGTISFIKARMKDFYTEKLLRIAEGIDSTQEAIKNIESDGIVFIDEIDKIALPENFVSTGKNISTDGVQRDLLPLVEGTLIKTKYGDVNTDHILFIASGAFSKVKPQDLIPELLGRFPIKVSLKGLTQQEFVRVLKEPEFNLLRQTRELLSCEKLEVVFTEEGIEEIAEQAFKFNQGEENIGVRRLHSILEKTLEEVSFEGSEWPEREVRIDREFIRRRLEGQLKAFDLSKYLI